MKSDKPLMLKDFLELDSNVDSIDTMRRLIETELSNCPGGRQLIRTRSKNAFSKLSSMIRLDFLLLSCSPGSYHKKSRSRNFSKKNQNGSFWKKKGKDEEKFGIFKVKDIVRLKSFNSPPSPVASISSSSSGWSQSDYTESDYLSSSNGSTELLPDVESVDSNCTGTDEKRSPRKSDTSTTGNGGSEEKVRCDSEEEEQLSPVSVMDFPSDEEEIEERGEESSSDSESCFDSSLACIERAKEELLQKIRRFECLAELGPLNLEEQFSAVDEESNGHVASDDEDEETSVERRALDLLSLIKDSLSISLNDCLEKLILDFFIDGLNNNICNHENDYLVEIVRKWIEGESNCWEQRDHRGEMEIGQMDINGPWRCFEEERREFAADLEARVWESLLDEVVSESVLYSVE